VFYRTICCYPLDKLAIRAKDGKYFLQPNLQNHHDLSVQHLFHQKFWNTKKGGVNDE